MRVLRKNESEKKIWGHVTEFVLALLYTNINPNTYGL